MATLDSLPALSPQLTFRDGSPVALFLTALGPNQMALMHAARVGGAFLSPSFVDRRAKNFDAVLLYHSVSDSYHDVTTGAADSMTGDLFHPVSGVTIGGASDRIYVGLEERFRYLSILLSTNGSGGLVGLSYFDGSGWKPLTPVSGNPALSSAVNQFVLWPDYEAMPGDWQKSVVNGVRQYWIRVECTSPFSTPPVGYQITAVSELKQILVRR